MRDTQPALRATSNKELVRKYGEWLICQRYSRTTLEVYNRVANRFLDYWGRRHFSQVTHLDVRRFILKMGERDLSGEIVHRYLWALRSFFDFLCLNGIADKSAPRLVRPRPTQRPLPRALSKRNVRRLLNAASNSRDRALLEVFYSTGCRISEIISVRLEDVDFKNRTIFVDGKSGERRVFFSSAARTWLLRYLAGRRSGYLFESQHRVQRGCVSWNGKGWVGYWLDYKGSGGERRQRSIYLGRPRSMGRAVALRRFRRLVPNPDEGHHRKKPHPISRSHVSTIFKTAAYHAGLAGITSHNLRHSFATHMLDNGADIRHVQELLGHVSLASTNQYAHIASVPIKAAYRKFGPRI
jgi:site-specific recombinase XerD